MDTRAIQYASFGQRLGAYLIDLLFLSSLTLARTIMIRISQPMAIIGFVIVALISLCYFIFFQQIRGKTLGKFLFGITVKTRANTKAGFGHFCLRYIYEIIVFCVGVGLFHRAIYAIEPSEYISFNDLERSLRILKEQPYMWLMTAIGYVYLLLNLVWFWRSKQYRALHDFFGSTIVVRDPKKGKIVT